MQSLRLGAFPTFLSGERVLAMRPVIRAACWRSRPTYRWHAAIPPLFDFGLYVTDQRVLAIAPLLRLVTFDLSQWFPDAATESHLERIVETRIGRGRWLGPYLEVASENPRIQHWLRSPRMTVRYYIPAPEEILEAIQKR